MRNLYRLCPIALMALLLSAVYQETTLAAGLLVAEGGFGGKLEIVEQNVRVTINNGIAVTQIDQIFRNTENRIVEALYTFPVPNGASVSNFSMVINGKEMIGEVVEKERAREIYNSYKSKRRDPGLLEQVDFKTFELRVFPIAAGAEQPISITYCQQLDFDHNQANYVYPLATNSQGPVDTKTRGKFSFTIDVKSEIPILKLVSPSHADDFVVTTVSPDYTQASLEVVEGDLNRDVVISYDVERPQTGVDLITSRSLGEDGYFLLSMTAGQELEELASGMDYVFIVDISGSMANDGKLMLSRAAVESFLQVLGSEDRFEVITFNTTPNLQFRELTAVTSESQNAAREFLANQRARGGTELRPAITTAYLYKDADRPLNVVVLSDGMTESNEQSQLLAAIREAASGTRVFCIGLGNDINRPLLKQVAEGAGGLAAFISHEADFEREAEAFRRKLMRPVATNVKIEIDGVGIYDRASDPLPDLYFGAPVWLSGRYKNPGVGQLTISAEVLGQPFTQSVELLFPETNDENPEIERMWAFQRVEKMMAEMRQIGKQTSLIDEVVRLCEGYSIVSEYASFLVLENDAEYGRWSIQRRNANRIQKDRSAQTKLRQQLDSMREKALADLGPTRQELVSTEAPLSRDDSTTVSANALPRMSNSPTLNQPVKNRSNLNIQPQLYDDSGGGAIDPFTGLIAISFAGASAWAARRGRAKGAA